MDLSELIFKRLQKSHINFDKTSIEESTGRKHPKYKVLIIRYQDIRVFHIFQSDKDSCSRRFRVCVAQADYDDKKPGHLENPFSYIDASRPDILDKERILVKIRDPKNRFEYIGKLCETKFTKLISLLKKARHHKYFPQYRQDVIKRAEECLVNETIERLKKI